MIVILDDTFGTRQKYNNINFLKDENYRDVCSIYEKPTVKDFRTILGNLDKVDLLCNHRSLLLFDKNGNAIDANKKIENLFSEVRLNGITRVEFGRDMHPNFSANTMDKSVFYSNLKSFLDGYISTQKLNLKLLFYGKNYKKMELMALYDNLINEINDTDFEKLEKNEIIKEGIRTLFRNQNPGQVINSWKQKQLTKKDIRLLINQKI